MMKVKFTPHDVARIIGVSATTIKNQLASGDFPYTGKSSGGHYTITNEDIKKYLEKQFKSKNRKAKILSLVNQKGGVGKTFLSYCITDILNYFGFKVLVIDSDQQSHMTRLQFRPLEADEYNFRDIFKNPENTEVIRKLKSGISIIPNRNTLPDDDWVLSPDIFMLLNLGVFIKRIEKDYDYIIIDTPPYISAETQSALLVADYTLLVLEPDSQSVTGISYITNLIKKLNESGNITKSCVLLGAVFNKVDKRTSIDMSYLDIGIKKIPESGINVFKTYIPYSTNYKTYMNLGKSMYNNTLIKKYRNIIQNFVLEVFDEIKKRSDR